MMPKNIKKKLILIAAILVTMLLIAGYWILPVRNASAQAYFEPIGIRILQEDEIEQFNYVSQQYEHLSFTGDEFRGWDPVDQLIWRYGIAFGAYAMPSVAMISNEYADRAKLCLRHMVDMKKSPKVWGDWIEYGLGDDPISKGNIMYRGHLNQMYGQLRNLETLSYGGNSGIQSTGIYIRILKAITICIKISTIRFTTDLCYGRRFI